MRCLGLQARGSPVFELDELGERASIAAVTCFAG
jgi:hypothetical protein